MRKVRRDAELACERLRCVDRAAGLRKTISCSDAFCFLDGYMSRGRLAGDIVYMDPPYFTDGNARVHNSYFRQRPDRAFHARLLAVAKELKKKRIPLVVCYKDHPTIRDMYQGFHITALKWRGGTELMISTQCAIGK